MKLLLIICIFSFSLLAESPVAKLGWMKGEIYILRHGKFFQVHTGFEIDEYDTIYSKNFSKAKIIFNNNYVYEVNGGNTLHIKTLMDSKKVLRVKTTQQIKKEALKENNPTDTFVPNSKFYKQRAKVAQKEYEKKMRSIYIDKKNNIYIDSTTENINNQSDDKSMNIIIDSVTIDKKSKVNGITIHGNSKNISNISQGIGTHSSAKVGTINVK